MELEKHKTNRVSDVESCFTTQGGGGDAGEFDELNHEIYEFIYECLNADDSDLLFPILKGFDGINTEKLYLNDSPLSRPASRRDEDGVEFMLGEKGNSSRIGENDPLTLNAQEGTPFSQEEENLGDEVCIAAMDVNNSMLKASFLGKTDILRSCLIKGADIKYTDKVGRTALHYAAACGWIPTMKLLLEFDCDINKRDHKRWTALHIAVSKKYPEIVSLLLSKGADIQLDLPHTCAPCRGGPINSKAIHFAAIKCNSTITELLLNNGADVNDRDQDDKTPLHYASFRTNLEYVKWLINKGADVNSRDKYGRIPLHIASLAGNVEIAKLLVSHGSMVDVKDIWDMSPLSLAITREHAKMKEYLKSVSKEAVGAADSQSLVRGFELDPLESVVLNTIVTGLKEPKVEFLARVIKIIGSQTTLEIYENTMKVENLGGIKTADGSRRKTIGGVFCHMLKQLASEGKISKQDWNYIRQEDKERVNARNILKRNNRRINSVQ
ncbi:ankyrin repeat protein [Cryptosporidium ryanae]|uniref:ankyrin repeat protein n=1 Tax=Cryptosporidium ryanae TaxID=515981 RepID=UPI00351A1C17|nr:ankyrin repeat protein [Cryptosporidium ryanae]